MAAEYYEVRLLFGEDRRGVYAWEEVRNERVTGYFDDEGQKIPDNPVSVSYVSRAPKKPPFAGRNR